MELTIEQRLQRTEALEAIRAVIYSYAAAGDRGNDARVVRTLFAENASYEAVGMGKFIGRDNIVSGLSEISRTQVLWSFHVPGGPLIKLRDDARSARAFWWAWIPVNLVAEGKPSPHLGAGHYNADLALEQDAWKFSRVKFETKLLLPHTGPWSQIEGDFEWLV